MRVLRWTLIAVVAAVLAGAAAVLASAALDQPSRYYRDAVVVEAPRSAIWSLLTEVERYDEWNPYITGGTGEVEEGGTLHLTFTSAGASETTASADVLVLHPRRKFEWRTRKLFPGVLDHEQTFRVLPLGSGRFRVVQEARFEGVASLLEDFDDERAGLVAMLAAIAELAPRYQSPSS
jgi:hypothetical protein